jgi:hypothetical protein
MAQENKRITPQKGQLVRMVCPFARTTLRDYMIMVWPMVGLPNDFSDIRSKLIINLGGDPSNQVGYSSNVYFTKPTWKDYYEIAQLAKERGFGKEYSIKNLLKTY